MERNTSEIADTSISDQMSPDDQKGQSPSQADTRTISLRTMDKSIFIWEEGEMLLMQKYAGQDCLDFD